MIIQSHLKGVSILGASKIKVGIVGEIYPTLFNVSLLFFLLFHLPRVAALDRIAEGGLYMSHPPHATGGVS